MNFVRDKAGCVFPMIVVSIQSCIIGRTVRNALHKHITKRITKTHSTLVNPYQCTKVTLLTPITVQTDPCFATDKSPWFPIAHCIAVLTVPFRK